MSEMENKEKTPSYKYIVSVKFANSKKAYNFGTNDETIVYGDKVVVETVRGMEIGEIISDLRDFASVNTTMEVKPVLRKATEKDMAANERNKADSPEAMKKCQQCIEKLGLEMYLISAEYTLDRSKVIFSYVADDRIDFRELLKQLAAIFRCRIELRQIGSRDKAKIIGGLGTCGMETCCSRFLDDFDIVSINMAKNQLLALNTQKLSGQCGKLMCCLKYEDDNYKSMRKGLPKLNALVEYEGEKFRITSMNLLNGSVRLSNRNNAIDMTLADLKKHLQIEDADDETEDN
ncbi:MAG: stage 0 sporulation protein [Erysipelotrichaceae bacterium]|nr:stage 0 sporulation protein [Erysipelotrichaceae bacterium]MBQ1304574.1 stage 0 sporulation protein [Erysipelotrichaceae bacterium]